MGHVGIEKKSTRTRSRNSFFYIYFQKFYWMAGVPKREKFGRLSRRKSVNIASAIARTICSTCQTQANNEPRHTCRYPKFFVVFFLSILSNFWCAIETFSCLRNVCALLARQTIASNDGCILRSQSYHSVPIFSVIVFFFLLLLLLTFLCASITHAGEDHDSYSKPGYRDAVESK